MGEFEYRTARWPEKEMERTTPKPRAMERIEKFLDGEGEEGRQRVKGRTDYRAWKDAAEVLHRVRARIEMLPLGEVVLIQRRSDLEQLSLLKLEKDVVEDLGCHPQLEIAHALIWDAFDVRSGGRWYCRYIDGTHTVSKHGYLEGGWKGAAEDVFVQTGGMAEQEKMANFVVAQAKAEKFRQLYHVISNERVWTPSEGWHRYFGQTHYHMHMDFYGGEACSP